MSITLSRCFWTGHIADLDNRPRCDHTEPVDTSISNIDPDPEPALDPAASRVLQETQKRDPEPASPQRSRHADKADNQALRAVVGQLPSRAPTRDRSFFFRSFALNPPVYLDLGLHCHRIEKQNGGDMVRMNSRRVR